MCLWRVPFSIGVLGSFFRGGQQFLSAKTQSCSAKKYPLRGAKFYNSVLPSWCTILLCHKCSASLNIGQKLLNDDSNTDKNGRKIGKYGRNQTKMAENRLNLAEKLAKYGGKGECWPCSVSALLSFPIFFCQTVNFFSAKSPNSVLPSLIFLPGGAKAPPAPPQERLWSWDTDH